MKAYIIVDVNINNSALYDEYKKLTPNSLLPFDGKFIVRGSPIEPLEGSWMPGRLVVLEFPSKEQAQAWWSSELYAPAKAIRQLASNTNMIMVEGVE